MSDPAPGIADKLLIVDDDPLIRLLARERTLETATLFASRSTPVAKSCTTFTP